MEGRSLPFLGDTLGRSTFSLFCIPITIPAPTGSGIKPVNSCSILSHRSVLCSNTIIFFHDPFSFNRRHFSYPNGLFFSFSPPFLCSVFCSLAVSPELPPRYLLGQAQRPNTITHVCWYRNQSLSLSDYLCMIQVKKPLKFCAGGRSHGMPSKMCNVSLHNCLVEPMCCASTRMPQLSSRGVAMLPRWYRISFCFCFPEWFSV